MIKKIGVITIGQSPRTDLIPEIENFFPPNIKFVQRGVLDKMDEHMIQQLMPEAGQTTLVSRLNNGTSATMGKEKVLPLIQEIIDSFNKENLSLIIIACTGEFELFRSRLPIVYPDFLLNHIAQGVFRDKGSIGVIVPLVEQFNSIQKKWDLAGFQAVTVASSPYKFDEHTLIKATKELNKSDIQAIVLDCIGYTDQMKQIVLSHTDKNVILSRNIVFRNVAELF